jgi:hypothetical protein
MIGHNRGYRLVLRCFFGLVFLILTAFACEKRCYIFGACIDTSIKSVILGNGMKFNLVNTNFDALAKEDFTQIIALDKPFGFGTTILEYVPEDHAPDPNISWSDDHGLTISITEISSVIQKTDRYRSRPIHYAIGRIAYPTSVQVKSQ